MRKHFGQRFAALLAALTLAFGLGLTVAPAASAGGYETSQTLVRGSDGLAGGIGLKAVDATTPTLSSGSIKSYVGSATLIRQVKAGSGYCVWEQAYRRPLGSSSWTFINDYHYGKSVSSRYTDLYTYSNIIANGKNWEYSSNLYIYAC